LASDLREGERLLTQKGSIKLLSKAIERQPQPVYNLEIRQWHNFLVGSSGIVVHNNCFEAAVNYIDNHPILKKLKLNEGKKYPDRDKPFDKTKSGVKKACDKFGRDYVCYDDFGFPDFSPFIPLINGVPAFVEITILDGNHSQSRTNGDFGKANEELCKKLGIPFQKFDQSDGKEFIGKDGLAYTWHHHQDGKTMILLPTEIHNRTAHVGGADVIKALKEKGEPWIDQFKPFKETPNFLSKCN
jgi:hypothetical protein